MRALDLDAIEERANAATAGPWQIDRGKIGGVLIHPRIVALLPNVGPRTVTWSGQDSANEDADLEFLRACRADVPALCAAVRERDADIASRAEERVELVSMLEARGAELDRLRALLVPVREAARAWKETGLLLADAGYGPRTTALMGAALAILEGT